KPRLTKSGVSVDMRGKVGNSLQVARDGHQVRFGLAYGEGKPVLFDLARATLGDAATASGLSAPRIDGVGVTDWKGTRNPKVGPNPLKLDQYETSHSFAVAPDAARFVLGGTWSLRGFDARGQELWRNQVPGVTWGVNVTPDGRIVVAAYGDGTIR